MVSGGEISNRKDLVRQLSPIIEQHDILRLKGFVAVAGKPMRLVVQAVGTRIDHYFDREWQAGESRQSRLVVIGLHGLNKSEIEKAVQAALA